MRKKSAREGDKSIEKKNRRAAKGGRGETNSRRYNDGKNERRDIWLGKGKRNMNNNEMRTSGWVLLCRALGTHRSIFFFFFYKGANPRRRNFDRYLTRWLKNISLFGAPEGIFISKCRLPAEFYLFTFLSIPLNLPNLSLLIDLIFFFFKTKFVVCAF